MLFPTLAAFVVAVPVTLSAQQLNILPEPIVRQIGQEISGDAAFAHIRHNSPFHLPRGGQMDYLKNAAAAAIIHTQ